MWVYGPKRYNSDFRSPKWVIAKIWGEPTDFFADDLLREQVEGMMRHPLAGGPVCLLADGHPGYGMPIGGVLATKGGVVPNAVGVDIGCGVDAVETNWDSDALSAADLQAIRVGIHNRVPTGMSRRPEPVEGWPPPDMERDLPFREQLEETSKQVGTLGGGNHFIELQRNTHNNKIWIMIHSGSRHIGLQVCNFYNGLAMNFMKMFKVEVPKGLAFLPNSLAEYLEYMNAMEWCMRFAEMNRQSILQHVVAAMSSATGVVPQIGMAVYTHHNYASMENWGGENLLVHRKGAVRAAGLVCVPGSMGTASYIGRGKNDSAAYGSCSHGAGRRMSRKEANRIITHDEAVESMRHVVFGVRQGDYDEMPAAYKDIDSVMEAQSDLVEPEYRLEPLMVVKGEGSHRRSQKGEDAPDKEGRA